MLGPCRSGILDSGGCGRSGSCIGSGGTAGRNRLAHPGRGCGTAQWRAWPVCGWGVSARHISGDRRDRTGGKCLPVLMPQPCHQFVDGRAGLYFADRSQMSVDGGSGGGSMAKVFLDDAQIDACFQQMGRIRVTQGMHGRLL